MDIINLYEFRLEDKTTELKKIVHEAWLDESIYREKPNDNFKHFTGYARIVNGKIVPDTPKIVTASRLGEAHTAVDNCNEMSVFLLEDNPQEAERIFKEKIADHMEGIQHTIRSHQRTLEALQKQLDTGFSCAKQPITKETVAQLNTCSHSAQNESEIEELEFFI